MNNAWVNWACGAVFYLVMASTAFAQSPASAPPSSDLQLTLYREAYQGAFTLLIPKGWKAEGGMLPSGVEWNLVDLVETNIRFRVSSPDGKSFFGWYPRFYFQDPAVIAQSSWGVLQPAPGQALNGCWLYPYLSLDQYVQTIIFGQLSAQEFQNPRILGPVTPAPYLQPWVPSPATHSQCGSVNFECSIGGTPMYGRIYAILYDLGGSLWSTVGTFGLIAPKDRWTEDERVMELCLRTFRLDPAWAAKASQAAAQRGKQYHETLQYMQGIDREIQQGHAQTNSDIQTEFYKVITDQIETRDPETGKETWLPSYNHAYTDGQGNYILKNTDDGTLPVDNATEWHKLEIINRNDPGVK